MVRPVLRWTPVRRLSDAVAVDQHGVQVDVEAAQHLGVLTRQCVEHLGLAVALPAEAQQFHGPDQQPVDIVVEERFDLLGIA
jgi:hypothetical protein